MRISTNSLGPWSDVFYSLVAVLRKAFQMFDTTKSGSIETIKISTILNTLGLLFDDGELQNIIAEVDSDSKSFRAGSAGCYLNFKKI